MYNYLLREVFQKTKCQALSINNTVTRKTRILTRITILIHLLLPLSLPFTPVIAATVLLPENSTVIHVDTEPYRLGTNETVESVAKKYVISVDELKRINIYRTFAKPFTALTVGDEIDVPRKKSPFTVDSNVTVPAENGVASNAAAGAALLSHGDAAKSAENMARSAVNNEISSSAQQWLGQFGTARIQFNTNDDFEFDSSAIDVLIPLYDNQKSLFFTQLGGRNKDSRNTINIGAGVRAFLTNWMYGANTFFDNDITGNNRRVGIGAEAWTDYLKLSANGYFGTTDWHQSRDFADYNERPANGYDLRAETYLPAYPQLGGKLMYEQYNGDEVALFGKDKRQKDPHAITVGINYTPVSLVTVGIDHRAGKSSKSDSSINLQFNYRLSNSWQSHIDPSAVAVTRTLAGSRQDLVERNNNIVLDYQKQELLRLSLPEQLTGSAGDNAILTAQIESKYEVQRVEWDANSLIAAGGNISTTSQKDVTITFPPYQYQVGVSNIYALSAIAYDVNGNISNRATTQIHVSQSSTIIISTLTVQTNNASANGTDVNSVVAKVTDANGNPIPGQNVMFMATNNASVITSPVISDTNGLAVTTINNTFSGISSVTANVNNTNEKSVDVVFLSITGVSVNVNANRETFSADAGFPKTGFIGAIFQININGGTTINNQLTWISNHPELATVDNNGLVSFISDFPSSTPISITATRNGGNAPLIYSFTVRKWFINPLTGASNNYIAAETACTNAGYSIPIIQDFFLAAETPGAQSTRGANGRLWDEWGRMANYTGRLGQWPGGAWSSTPNLSVPGFLLTGGLNQGQVNSTNNTSGVVCSKNI
ncbi:YrIlm family inverse autotransporter adhesin [Yersinia aldovae]|uniref:YrIlm family inverse autotransporter adhesin n=1 Tax=Yersinia aldovae TaxID=29483 RepID=UPI0011A5E71F|nr:YrIlm family inverse autotransporter adhesin [Yersinia aldovae]